MDHRPRTELLGAVDRAFMIMAALLAALAAPVRAAARLPGRASRPNHRAAAPAGMFEALRSPWALFGALAIGLYVGAEVSIGSIMINFLNQRSVLGLPFESAGAYLANFYWGGALRRTAGRNSATHANPRRPPARCLRHGRRAALPRRCLPTHGPVAGYAALSIGFFNSIMFPTIFTITLERSGVSQSSTSGPAVPGHLRRRIAADRGWRHRRQFWTYRLLCGPARGLCLHRRLRRCRPRQGARDRRANRRFAHCVTGGPRMISEMVHTLLAATSLAAQPPRSILFIGNSFTFGADSAAMTYRKDSVTDLNGDGMGGVPALFKRFADEAGLRYRVSLETAAGQTLTWHLANRRAVIDRRGTRSCFSSTARWIPTSPAT